jgi:hypothetical protein
MADKKKKPVKTVVAQPTVKAVPRLYTMLPTDAELVEQLRFRYQREALARTSRAADIAKSEIIRAGIQVLSKMSDDQLYKVVEQVEELPEGRPKKEPE